MGVCSAAIRDMRSQHVGKAQLVSSTSRCEPGVCYGVVCCVLFCLSVPSQSQTVCLAALGPQFFIPLLDRLPRQRRASAICGGVEEDGHHRHRRGLHRRETARRAAGANQVSGKTNHTVLQAGRRARGRVEEAFILRQEDRIEGGWRRRVV